MLAKLPHQLDAQQSSSLSPSGREDGDDRLCVVCMEHPAAVMSLPCLHSVACHTCAAKIGTTSNNCPMSVRISDTVVFEQSLLIGQFCLNLQSAVNRLDNHASQKRDPDSW